MLIGEYIVALLWNGGNGQHQPVCVISVKPVIVAPTALWWHQWTHSEEVTAILIDLWNINTQGTIEEVVIREQNFSEETYHLKFI